jgi:hypothetical protein
MTKEFRKELTEKNVFTIDTRFKITQSTHPWSVAIIG